MNAHASDKTRILALAAAATLGFGLLQGARLLDLNTGPYSPSPYALVGLVADGLTFLVVAVLSYLGRIDRAKPLFVTAVVVSSIYASSARSTPCSLRRVTQTISRLSPCR